MSVQLGDRVKDKISGLKGIVIGVTEWLYGCRRITVQPEEAKDGKPADAFTVDDPQCDVVDRAAIAPAVVKSKQTRSHGPRQDAPRY